MKGDLIHAVIKHRSSDGEVTDTLKIPKEEYEKILRTCPNKPKRSK